MTAEILDKMIRISNGNTHDIAHFMKVWGFARTIGLSENLDMKLQEQVEITAIIHDIACPLCRIKYGSAPGNLQEKESPALVKDFLQEFDLPEEEKERICFVVSHHHTYTGIDGIDWQILLEADFLVNADESSYQRNAIIAAERNFFRTAEGKKLLESIYLA